MNPIKVCILGLGRSGWDIHATTVAGDERFEVTVVADAQESRRQEAVRRFGCAAYTDPQEAIEDANSELVVVATPSHTHAPLACHALASGKHVLVEKPMATNLAEAEAMRQQALQSGKILSVYHMLRLDPTFLKIKEIVESGVLGKIHLVKFSLHIFERRRDWQMLRKFGGGVLNNKGAHFIDLALLLTGGQWREPFVDMQHTVGAGDAEDHVKVVFKTADDLVVDVEISHISPYGAPLWSIHGEYGGLRCSGNIVEWMYYDPTQFPLPEVDEGPAVGRVYGSGEKLEWREHKVSVEESASPHQLFYDRFHASLREGAPLLVPPEEAINLIKLLETCRNAAGF